MKIDYQIFLKRHNLRWDSLPKGWEDAPFVGNGLMGAYVFSQNRTSLEWEIGRTDIVDHRKDEDTPLYAKRRLPIGRFIIQTTGEIVNADIELNLYNAQIECSLKTARGHIFLSAYVHATLNIIVFQAAATDGEDYNFEFVPADITCPERQYSKIKTVPKDPEPQKRWLDGYRIAQQKLLAGSEFSTVFKPIKVNESTIAFLSVDKSLHEDNSISKAKACVDSAINAGADRLRRTHDLWWKSFYEKSFLSIPDTRLEGFYWIQLYKLASATRADKPAIDLMGPWFKNSPWLIIWWNLNIQLTYWATLPSNHTDLNESFTKMLNGNLDNLARNVPKEFQDSCIAIGRTTSYDCVNDDLVGKELSNLPWACHSVWLHYRYTMDKVMLKNEVYPLIKKTMNFYIKLLFRGEDGRYHLPHAISPEYPEMAQDTNVDLALLRFGLKTLLDICTTLAMEDEMKQTWEDILENLTEYCIDETGLMIGKGVPLAISHRHYSHLLAIYPLYLINWRHPEHRGLIKKSVERWLRLQGKLEGYTYTGASSMYASMGMAHEALHCLNEMIDNFIECNTMYKESGPVIETPLSAAKSIQDMVIQSWGDYIEIFPCIPDSWKDVAIADMRTEGAFLVSAVKKGGETVYVKIKSLAGEKCVFKMDMEDPITDGNTPFREIGENIYEVNLLEGEAVTIYKKGCKTIELEPVAAQKDYTNYFGNVSGLRRKSFN